MNETFISIEDYAASLGISIDTAKEKLSFPEYKKYCKEINGIFLVSTSILSIQEGEVETPEVEQEKEEIEETSAAEVKLLRKEVEELRQAVREKDKQISEFAVRFAELAQQAQVIAGQAQVLQAANNPKAIEAQTTAADNQPPQKRSFWKRLFS